MYILQLLRPRPRAVALVATCLVLAGCVASETVTISDPAIATATTTAPSVEAPTLTAADEPTAVLPAGSEPTAIPPAGSEATPVPPAGSEATPVPAAAGESGCRFDSIDDFDDIQIELEYISDLTVQDDALVNYVVYDGTGEVIVTSSTYVEDLKPGEPVRMAVDTVEDAPLDAAARAGITCDFLNIQPLGFVDGPFRPGSDDSCRFVEVDSFDDIQIEISLVNPANSPGELAVDYALRGPNGIRFGDGVMFTDVLDPGERLSQGEDTVTEFPAWVSLATFSCEILAIEEF